jgi:predicted secreted protein
MTWFTGLMVYAIIWWVVLFAVLPWGVHVPDQHEPGHATSAPEKPMLWRKAAVTTAIATVLWVIAYYLITSDLISFREP